MSREAMELALEAFGEIAWSNETQWQRDRAKKAITAIKQALEQPEPEPVAWRNAAMRVGEDLCSVGPFGYYDMTAEQWLDWALSVVTVHARPPKRKPLTDEEIDNAVWHLGFGQLSPREVARAIEAAHGIKGEA